MSIIDRLLDIGGFLRVRAILAFVFGGVYAYLAIEGHIPPEDVKEVTLLVVAFYFFTRSKA